MTILDNVKAALRLTTAAFDDLELAPMIDACKTDLRLAGVRSIDDKDPLIVRAVVLYAKAHFGFDELADRYQRTYDLLKASLALSYEYGGGPANES